MKKIILLSIGLAAYCWLMTFLVTHEVNPVNWDASIIVILTIVLALTVAAMLYVHFRGEDKPAPIIIYEVWDNGPHGYYQRKEDAIARMHEVAEEYNKWHTERNNPDCIYRWREEHQCYYSRFGALRIVEAEVK